LAKGVRPRVRGLLGRSVEGGRKVRARLTGRVSLASQPSLLQVSQRSSSSRISEGSGLDRLYELASLIERSLEQAKSPLLILLIVEAGEALDILRDMDRTTADGAYADELDAIEELLSGRETITDGLRALTKMVDTIRRAEAGASSAFHGDDSLEIGTVYRSLRLLLRGDTASRIATSFLGLGTISHSPTWSQEALHPRSHPLHDSFFRTASRNFPQVVARARMSDGRVIPIALPVRFKAYVAGVGGLVSTDQLQELFDRKGITLKPLSVAGQSTLVFVLADFHQNSIPQNPLDPESDYNSGANAYRETIIATFGYDPDAPLKVVMIPLQLAVTDELAQLAGVQFGGFPKELGDVFIAGEGRNISAIDGTTGHRVWDLEIGGGARLRSPIPETEMGLGIVTPPGNRGAAYSRLRDGWVAPFTGGDRFSSRWAKEKGLDVRPFSVFAINGFSMVLGADRDVLQHPDVTVVNGDHGTRKAIKPSIVRGSGGDKRKVVVIGGAGAIGAAIVQEAADRGMDVVAVGRRPYDEVPEHIRAMFASSPRIGYEQIDVFDINNIPDAKDLYSWADIVVLAAEPSSKSESGVGLAMGSMDMFLHAIRRSSIRDQKGLARKVVIRIGSSQAEIRGDPNAPGFEEDRPWGDMSKSHPAWDVPYFRTRRELAGMFDNAIKSYGIPGMNVSPTTVISPWADHGDMEPVVGYFNQTFPPIVPSVPIDVVAAAEVATGVFQAAERGRLGETYQLAGVSMKMSDVILAGLRYAGMEEGDLPNVISLPTGLWSPVLYSGVASMLGAKRLLARFGRDLPVWLDPMSLALTQVMGGERSSEKASVELGYEPSTERDVLSAVREQIDFLKARGRIE